MKRGVRAVQPDLVVHMHRDAGVQDGPRVGLVVSKSIGGAVERHRVARRLRHASRAVLGTLAPTDQMVIRALPGSLRAKPEVLQQELTSAVDRARQLMERAV